MDTQPDSGENSVDSRSSLEVHFQRIVNGLVEVWPSAEKTDRFLNDILVDDRYDREGFPESVFTDLMFLSDLNWKRTHIDQDGVEIRPDNFSFGRPI